MAASRKLAEREGVALNQLINVAVAQLIATSGTIDYLEERAKRGDSAKALAILNKSRKGEPPREGDELPEGWPAEGVRTPQAPRHATRKTSPK